MDTKAREYAQEVIKFIRKSGSSFLACKNLRDKLINNGLIPISEGEKWNLQKNEGYVLSKENRNICSFFIGKNFNIENGSILISIGHIDSCALKISPNNNIVKSKINQINVECYGSGLWNTWFDRGLGLSGQVVFKKDNKLIERLIQINKSLFFLPSLAIHLQHRTRFEFTVKINYETHLKPILSTVLYDQLIKKRKGITKKSSDENELQKRQEGISTQGEGTTQDHLEQEQKENVNSSPLLYILAKELNCNEEDILDFELCLMDAQEPCFTGVYEEFIEGARFDNLVGSFCVFEAFIELVKNVRSRDVSDSGSGSGEQDKCSYDNNLYICIGYDHEEIGSLSEIGAQSYFTKNFIERIITSIFMNDISNGNTSVDEIYGNLVNRSFILNVDMAHCSHPNYPETVQTNHHLYFHEGIAIKYNTNKNYVTAPYYACLIKRTFELFANEYKQTIKYQNFMVKNDTPCGSTVGSMVASNLSMPGIDIGIPQLAMHSIREIAAVHDIYYLIKGTLAFYTYYNRVLSSCVGDT
ncbi:M18 aspartyl aminopeptidase [Plasmodium brasilianum]|uniref:aspartyl aminopeptidase n=2 Tax=Plasmodium (Plasmodium) TaxID=418103 RepID=A0A1A8VXQ2_PLAMA|nr:M18 aspartyl aminopeptidase, putative [Plasmodium malariae]KAI4839552.1 M18 aspartyl aminopeptidase [Plasmodium brasilianum]SBS84137.1 M18 aspartyl aminopeptidase, putative (M18AAP) [Plasmodium malariae]SBT87978.1 M18 aspartyl aminopeptidase, putative [Plasmodium malariae]